MIEKRIQCNLAVFEKKDYTIEKLAVDELTVLALGDAEAQLSQRQLATSRSAASVDQQIQRGALELGLGLAELLCERPFRMLPLHQLEREVLVPVHHAWTKVLAVPLPYRPPRFKVEHRMAVPLCI